MSWRWRAVAVCAVAMLPSAAQAEVRERDVEIDRSAARELYIRARPRAPERPELPEVLADRLERAEARVGETRAEAIELLRAFLAGDPGGEGRAEGLFRLAELLWEDAHQRYLDDLLAHERALERCRRRPGACEREPPEPKLDLREAEELYLVLLRDHPRFRRADLILYLAGFAAQQDGRDAQARERLAELIQRFPRSSLVPDAWMLVGESSFGQGEWTAARTAYERVLEHPDSGTYDLALFKAAWCDWQLGDSERAVARFKRVLDLADRAEARGDRTSQRRAQLRDEALDYLVLVFTEDESVSAQDVYEFLASIGGRRYSREVLTRLAEMFHDQADYDRSIAAYRFLIELDPEHIDAATYQRRVVEGHLADLAFDRALEATRVLAVGYGPGSDWAEAQTADAALARQLAASEELVRTLGKTLHAEAQDDEERRGRAQLSRYALDERAYASYLGRFAEDEHAAEVRFLRAEILYFKLDDYERAGDEYLAVGRTAPVGEFHRDALLRAMNAFERVRPDELPARGGRELLPVDRKFAEATDLYATLFPDDPEIVDVVFRNGMLFYDYGDYDEAVKRFGLIVTKHPGSPNAGPAGDRILEALGRSKDYENIETWARRLKDADAFSARDQQARLDRLIVESILKSGETYAEGGYYERAARFYLRVPAEFPDHPATAEALQNAGVMLERARQPEEAALIYLRILDEHPRSELAEAAGFAAAEVYESFAYFDRAAEAYELVAEAYPRGEHGADALFNAGVLRQALGQPERAIAHYERYAERYRSRDDAEEVAFRVGVVYEAAGDDGRAFQAFRSYVDRHRGGDHVVEALMRAGRAAIALGRPERAARQLRAALAAYERRRRDRDRHTRFAAEARYLQGELLYREYAALGLDVAPARLRRTLDRKTALLERAQGIYLDVVDVGDPAWATAALYRIGSVFDEYATSLRDASVPDGLTGQQAARYREELDIYVIDVEERAIELYTVGYDRALELGVYNEFTSRLREALGRMSPSRYPPEHEARARERIGERAVELDVIVEVVRRGE